MSSEIFLRRITNIDLGSDSSLDGNFAEYFVRETLKTTARQTANYTSGLSDLDENEKAEMIRKGKERMVRMESSEYNWCRKYPDADRIFQQHERRNSRESLEDAPPADPATEQTGGMGGVDLNEEGPTLEDIDPYDERNTAQVQDICADFFRGKTVGWKQLLSHGKFGNAHSGKIPIKLSAVVEERDDHDLLKWKATTQKSNRAAVGAQVYKPGDRKSWLKDQYAPLFDKFPLFAVHLENLLTESIEWKQTRGTLGKGESYRFVSGMLEEMAPIFRHHVDWVMKLDCRPARVEVMCDMGHHEDEDLPSYPFCMDRNVGIENLFSRMLRLVKQKHLALFTMCVIENSWFPLLSTFLHNGDASSDYTALSMEAKTALMACPERVAKLFDCQLYPIRVHQNPVAGTRLSSEPVVIPREMLRHLSVKESVMTGLCHGVDPRCLTLAQSATRRQRQRLGTGVNDYPGASFFSSMRRGQDVRCPKSYCNNLANLYQLLQAEADTDGNIVWEGNFPLFKRPRYSAIPASTTVDAHRFVKVVSELLLNMYLAEWQYIYSLIARKFLSDHPLPDIDQIPPYPETVENVTGLINSGFQVFERSLLSRQEDGIRNGRITKLGGLKKQIFLGFPSEGTFPGDKSGWNQSSTRKLGSEVALCLLRMREKVPEDHAQRQEMLDILSENNLLLQFAKELNSLGGVGSKTIIWQTSPAYMTRYKGRFLVLDINLLAASHPMNVVPQPAEEPTRDEREELLKGTKDIFFSSVVDYQCNYRNVLLCRAYVIVAMDILEESSDAITLDQVSQRETVLIPMANLEVGEGFPLLDMFDNYPKFREAVHNMFQETACNHFVEDGMPQIQGDDLSRFLHKWSNKAPIKRIREVRLALHGIDKNLWNGLVASKRSPDIPKPEMINYPLILRKNTPNLPHIASGTPRLSAFSKAAMSAGYLAHDVCDEFVKARRVYYDSRVELLRMIQNGQFNSVEYTQKYQNLDQSYRQWCGKSYNDKKIPRPTQI